MKLTQEERMVLKLALIIAWGLIASLVLGVMQLNMWIRGFYAH